MGMSEKLKAKARAREEEIVEAPKKAVKANVAEKPVKAVKAAVAEDKPNDEGVNFIELVTAVYAERNEGEALTKTLAKEVWECIKESIPEAVFMNGTLRLGKLGALQMDVRAGRTGVSKLTPKLSKEDIAAGKVAKPVETEWTSKDKWVAVLRMSNSGEDLFAALEEETGDTAAAYLAEREAE